MKNDARAIAERPPPDPGAVRRDLAAARRTVRKLTAALEKTGGQELFAADASSLTSRLRDAQGVVHDCEAGLRPGRAHLTVVPDGTAPTVDALPSVAELLGLWQDSHAVATGPARPRGTGPLRVQVRVRLQDATERERRLRDACAMLPEGHRAVFADLLQVAERQQAYELEQLRYLDDPEHPSAVTLRVWEELHPDVDRTEAETRAALDAAVTVWALGPGRDFVPALPTKVSSADRHVWLIATAHQLAYRELYRVTDGSPLGAEPWPKDQGLAWNEARAELSRVGVIVTNPTQVVGLVTRGRRRSLSAALAGVG